MASVVKAFTYPYPKIVNELMTVVEVAEPVNRSFRKVNAIWDTGATNSVISQDLAIALGLNPVGFTDVSGVNATTTVPVYFVTIKLPNDIEVTVRVTEGSNCMGCHVLVGMDIISQGDFCVSNHGGATTFTFRLPSVQRTDYVKEIQEGNRKAAEKRFPNVGRNDACPCGSGKKFKKCCGRDI